MFAVLGCLNSHHNPYMLVAAFAMCAFACVTARLMVLRARDYGSNQKLLWLCGAGAIAGAGVWTTHFVAILAYDSGLPTRFNIGLTIVSVIAGIGIPAIAGALFTKGVGGAASGMLFAAGILVMHYTGISALDVPAYFLWNPAIIAFSILVGITFGGIAGHVSAMPATTRTNILSTSLRVATILTIHFCGMMALRVVPSGGPFTHSSASMSGDAIWMLVVGLVAFVIGQALVLALVDRHLKGRAEKDAVKLRAYIAELEDTKSNLQLAQAAAEAASKSKSAFLASMSHELRTPLNAVIGFSEMVLTEPLGPIGIAKYKDYIGNVHDSGQHLLELVNDVLDIARFDAGHAELEESVFDPNNKIRDTVRMMSAQAAKARIALVCDIPATLPMMNGDKRRVRQILLNLISNALKFTNGGGTVRVRARLAAGLVIEVIDTGIGMSPKDFSKALEPFGQVDSSLARKYEGTGLGRPITRQMTELHGGTLSLESTLGKGTTVTVTFPAWRLMPSGETAAA